MSAYFNGSGNSQIRASSSSSADGLQTLIFMNPNNNSNLNNPNNHNKTDFVFINSSMSPATTHQLVGIPLHHENVSPSHGLIPRPQYNLWTPIESSTVARETPRAQQGLSLSLSNSQVGFNGSLQQLQAHSTAILSPSENTKDEGMETPSPASVISNGPVTGMRSVLMSSKYLKATQQLLEEIVNVGSSTPTNTASSKKKDTDITNNAADTSPDTTAAAKAVDGQNTGKGSAELSTTEKQEIHLKKGKLICILNEVEQRYRQYHQQMQIVIASFEQAAGRGSAKTYTALALKTISRQFRCLKDAILTQISAVNKSLGEEEDVGEKELGGSVRLKFVDHHLRQQLALQQLGMIQHHNNAWRPQRGLPERSVSVLRAWLFEHFLHPYPKDSDKQMLARQTGLTRSQVSNWFINARVRLWKPMVEEMYNEELKEHENQVQGSADKTGSASTSKVPTEEKHNLSFKNASQETTGFSLIGTPSSELEGIGQMSPKRQRINDQMVHHHHHHHLQHQNNPSSRFQSAAMEMNSNDHLLVKFGIERQPRDHDYSLMAVGPANFIGGFGSYPMEEIGRFDVNQFDQSRFSGNGVSLTLGRTDTPQSFIPTQSSGEWTLQARQLNSVP